MLLVAKWLLAKLRNACENAWAVLLWPLEILYNDTILMLYYWKKMSKWYKDETKRKHQEELTFRNLLHKTNKTYSVKERWDTCPYALCFPSDIFVLPCPALSCLVCQTAALVLTEDKNYSELGSLLTNCLTEQSTTACEWVFTVVLCGSLRHEYGINLSKIHGRIHLLAGPRAQVCTWAPIAPPDIQFTII